MNIQFYIEKLENLEDYKKFVKENPSAFLCSGFFVIDKQGNDNKQHFDYFIPEKNTNNKNSGKNQGKMFSFQLEDNKLVPMEKFEKISENSKESPSKMNINYDFDFNEIEEIILKEIEEKNIKTKVQKYIFSLQKIDNKDYLVGTVFISMLGLLKINILLPEKKITRFEKKSVFDIMKVKKNK